MAKMLKMGIEPMTCLKNGNRTRDMRIKPVNLFKNGNRTREFVYGVN
jgi:hypothetical protein